MTPAWVHDAMFYHIYPFGLCGAPQFNPFTPPSIPRLETLYPWIEHIAALNLNAVYLGPVFESVEHGYDTADYFKVDGRLGDNDTLKALIHAMKARGLRVILDGVFNHVGRQFWAFKDIQAKGEDSPYLSWFSHLDFSQPSPYGDAFNYEGWEGHYDLIKLNQDHPQVRQHLFEAITLWVKTFDIDGLRLAGSETYSPDFMRALAAHCRQLKPDFWLLGEVGQADYRQWVKPEMLDSTANYEFQRVLYAGLADRDYRPLADILEQQFGAQGQYRDLRLYGFIDNHDVNRAASSLSHPANLYPLYTLLFSLPMLPALYYGSEWGVAGVRLQGEPNQAQNVDAPLRPALQLSEVHQLPMPELQPFVAQLAALRQRLPALRYGTYQSLFVAPQQLVFERVTPDQRVLVALNNAPTEQTLQLRGLPAGARLHNVQTQADTSITPAGTLTLQLAAHSGQICLVY